MDAARKSNPTIGQDRIGLAEHKRRDWVVDIQMGITLEDVLEPSYWAHIAMQLNPGDHLEIRTEDSSWMAYLVVLMCERNYATVALDRVLKFTRELEAPVSSIKHKVEWKGPVHKWSVIRVADSSMLHNGESSRELANAWLVNHERTPGI